MNSIRRVVIQGRVHCWGAAAAAATAGSAYDLWNDTSNNKIAAILLSLIQSYSISL